MMGFLAKQKFRFDLGVSFAIIVNLALLSITASPTLAPTVGLSPRTIVYVLVPGVLILVWFMGFVLDKLGFPNAYQNEQNLRNQMLKDALKEMP